MKYDDHIPNIKTLSLQLYLQVNDKCSKQLKEGILNLCKKLYYENWNDLPSSLITVANHTVDIMIRILSLFQGMTYRYGHEARSDPLYSEIIFSCDEMHDFLFLTCQNIIQSLTQNPLDAFLKALKQCLKLFYNLNYQDLHPKFEDNLNEWIGLLSATLKLEGDPSNVQLFKCKAAALKSILLYSNKYEEDILEVTIKGFSEQAWALFTNMNL